jgi:hypothetical protein
VLGIPVDHPASSDTTKKAWADAAAKIEKASSTITSLTDAQVAHHLLRSCLDGCKVNHLLRASDSYGSQDQVTGCSEVIMNAFEDILGTALNPQQRTQASLPLSSGGCGLRVPSCTQPAARISCLADFYSDGARRVGVPDYASGLQLPLVAPVLDDLRGRLGANHATVTTFLHNPQRLASADQEPRRQKWWNHELGKKAMDGLVDQARPRDQNRLLEPATGFGHGWMAATPSNNSLTTFSSEEYTLGLKWWLGLPVLEDVSQPCTGCGQPLDQEGDHLLCCRRNNFSARHNAVQDALFQTLSNSGHRVQKEVSLPTARDSHLRPADLLLDCWSEGKPTALDVTVCHGWQAAEHTATRERWRSFLKRREDAKKQKYNVPCQQAGWGFTPFALGTWGGMGPETAKTLSRVAKRASSWQQGAERETKQAEIYQNVAIALLREVFHLLQPKHVPR